MDGFRDALLAHGFFDVVTRKLVGADHAFQYWNAPITLGGPTVGADVIAFLNAHLP